MPSHFETVSDVFPDQGATPFMVMNTIQSDPQWFPSIDALIAYVNRNESAASAGVWIDISSGNLTDRRQLLNAISFGTTIPSSVMDAAIAPNEVDVVELHASAQYVCGTFAFTNNVEEENLQSKMFAKPAEGEVESDHLQPRQITVDEFQLCSFVASRRVIVTMHNGGFTALFRTINKLGESNWYDLHFHNNKNATTNNGSTKNVANTNNSLSRANSQVKSFSSFEYVVNDKEQPCFTSVVLASLISSTSESILPDPRLMLSEVDSIDEMVPLIAPGDRDQPDFVRRIAQLRRRIATARNTLYLKESLLLEMLTPAMRASFVCAHGSSTVQLYLEAMEKVVLIADRLDETRKVLNQANLNFVQGVAMRMSQSSAGLDFKMQILGQMATICLPLNFFLGLQGMNCVIPYQTDFYPTLTPFWCVVAIMVGWAVICSIPTIRCMIRGTRPRSIVPAE